jgi:pilus assembly protein FimV
MRQLSLARVRVMRWVLVAVLATAPVFVYALGMGKLVLRSGLDEPLMGEIEISSLSPQELKTLKPTLGSRADFDSAGIERPFFLTGIKYEVTQHDGRAFLRLSTDEPIREPFLHLLLQLEWSGGKLIREYTALLDPPQWATAKPAEIQPPNVATDASATTQADTGASQGAAVAPDEWTAAPNTTTHLTADEPVAGTPPAEMTSTAPTPAPVTAPTAVSPAPEPASAAVSETTERQPDAKGVAPSVESRGQGTVDAGETRAWASTWEYGPVKRGDTLGHIAGKLRVDKTLTTQQIMIALLRANPSAFYAKNVNNLKAGTILKVPERDEIESISKASARAEFQAQYEVWQKYKSQVAAASSAVTVPGETRPAPVVESKEAKPGSQETKPLIAAKPAAKASAPTASAKHATSAKKESPAVQPAAEGDEDLLKIVRSNLQHTPAPETAKAPGVETSKDAAKEQRALTEKVATLEEAIESKELQNKEMRERVGKMQEQAKNTSRLIDLENKSLAQAQKQAAENAKLKPEPVAPIVPPPVAAVPVPATPPKAEVPVTAQAKPPAAVPAPGASKKPVAKPATAPPAPVEETDFVQQITDNLTGNPLLLMVLAGVGVLGAGIFAIHLVRRRRASAEFEESILSGGSVGPDNSSISESTSQPGASDTSFLSDFSQGGMGNVHTDEVDPIAEAEVYLAYGRDEQAEEILKEAVVKDPARHELKQKLLEIYHQRNDVSGFETLAEELYAALEGKGGKVWDKVEEMGRKISPSNPMFRGGAPTRGAGAAAMPADLRTSFERDANERAPAPSSQSLDFDMGEMLHDAPSATRGSDRAAPMDTGLDFDLGGTAATPEVSLDLEFDSSAMSSSGGADKGGLDMDFNLHDEEPPPARGSGSIDFDIPAEPLADSEISLDFDAPGGHDTHADEGLTFAMDATAADNPTLEFESSGEETDSDVAVEEQQWDETATKLDLAKAYIDMGDAEGARSILDEVLAEGNESQKRQAHELAAQIH